MPPFSLIAYDFFADLYLAHVLVFCFLNVSDTCISGSDEENKHNSVACTLCRPHDLYVFLMRGDPTLYRVATKLKV